MMPVCRCQDLLHNAALRLAAWAASFGVVAALLGCLPAATAAQATRPTTGPALYTAEPGLRDLIGSFSADYDALQRFYPLRGSDARAQRLREFLQRWEQQLGGVEYGSLDQISRIDFLLLRYHIAYELRSLEHEQARDEEMRSLIPFASDLLSLEEARLRMEGVDPRTVATAVSEAIRRVEETRKQVEALLAAGRRGDVPAGTQPASAPAGEPAGQPVAVAAADGNAVKTVDPAVAVRAADRLGALRRSLRSWNENQQQFEPAFAWWVSGPYAKLDKALEDYAKFLNERVAGVRGQDDDPLIGDPIGRNALLSDLEAEMIGYSPEQIIAIGQRELAWCRGEMEKAAAEMGFDEASGGWRAALEKTKQQYVDPGQQDETVRRLAQDAIDFVDQHDLVTVPDLCRETWNLEMLDSRRQRTWPFAAYGGQRMLVAFATSDMDHDQKLQAMRGNNVPFTRLVAGHELIPGHHLQSFMAQRYRTWRQTFSTPFYVEGWALHWEMVFWDRGFPRTPEEKMGMLFWRAHRAARIIVSLKFHLGEMTPPEMIDFLVNEVGHERDNATSEVRRFIGGQYSPLYQAAYMIGGIQINALHKELVGGGKMTDRAFHDEILKQNSIPIAMVRAALLALPLEEPQIPEWDFAGKDLQRAGSPATRSR